MFAQKQFPDDLGRLVSFKQVLMSNPTIICLHADEEYLVVASLGPYYELVRETALMGPQA